MDDAHVSWSAASRTVVVDRYQIQIRLHWVHCIHEMPSVMGEWRVRPDSRFFVSGIDALEVVIHDDLAFRSEHRSVVTRFDESLFVE